MANIQPTSVRLDKDLYERIRQDAEKERRSITGQIEYMLLQYYEMKKLMLK
ncbi:MAG: ribbon-helix-helix protein, CopG family [Oscillospiraceae bacterium]|nr:ribbon-helix-helix protein, CopG family [Oscillospiraceae bacterium]